MSPSPAAATRPAPAGSLAATRPAPAGSRAATRPAAADLRAAARSAAPARRPVGPRRVSGPARPAHPAAPAERVQRPATARPASAPFTQHVARVVDHSLLDRLIRGRAWIGLIAFALIGIVAMQVTLLRLNSGIGRSIERATALQRESSLLAAQVAGLSSAQRVQAEATKLGMVYAPPDDVRYLRVSAGDATRAATSFVPPATGTTGSAGLTATAATPATATTSATAATSATVAPPASSSATGATSATVAPPASSSATGATSATVAPPASSSATVAPPASSSATTPAGSTGP